MGRRLRSVAIAGAAAIAIAGCSRASSPPVEASHAPSTGAPIRVEGAWASSAGRLASVYFILSNHGSRDDSLTGASSRIAIGARIMDGAEPVASLSLPAGGELSFDGGRYVLTLTGLERRLASDDTVRVTLTFARAAPVSFVAGVR